MLSTEKDDVTTDYDLGGGRWWPGKGFTMINLTEIGHLLHLLPQIPHHIQIPGRQAGIQSSKFSVSKSICSQTIHLEDGHTEILLCKCLLTLCPVRMKVC